MISEINVSQWQTKFTQKVQQQALVNLEQGVALYAPDLSFSLSAEEQAFLTPTILTRKAKNVSYHPQSKKIGGVEPSNSSYRPLQAMMDRYVQSTSTFLIRL